MLPLLDLAFVTLDRFDAHSRVAVDAAYVEPAAATFGTNTEVLARGDAHVRYVDPQTGLGGYAQLPVLFDREKYDRTLTGIGDLEVGGIYAHGDLVAHVGVALPTGAGDDEGNAAYYASHSQLRDLYLALPSATTVRAGLSWQHREGNWFARADLGLDWNISGDTDITVGNGVHANLGVGVDLGAAALTLESANLAILDDPHPGDRGPTSSHELLDTIAVAVHAGLPYLGVVLPLDDDTSLRFDFAIIAGADFDL